MQMHERLFRVCFCSRESKMDIPASDSFASPIRKGFLLKLCGRGWLYSGSWKRRYCVLDGSKFYFYEKEVSKGNEKTCGVLNLDYFDVCEESISSRDKKNPHVFVVGTSVKGFFDNRHQFSAETGDDLQTWIRSIQSAIADARENRRKPAGKKQRHLEEADITTPSQGDGEPARLVAATKDRVKGPQGRRLPQRKSMMPTSRNKEEEDIRQRSISLSSPKRLEEEDATPPISPSDGGKWLSLSMEDVERDKAPSGLEDEHRSSSVFELQKSKDPLPRGKGGLLGQHAALTRELEMRLKAGKMPAHVVRPPSQAEEDAKEEEESKDKRLDALSCRVDEARRALSILEDKMDHMTKKMEVGDVMLQLTVTLKEAERINDECRRALSDANLARTEYQLLAKECKETLDRFRNSPEDPESQQHGA